MTKTKGEKGITLIALIITIIVMLILAGVALQALRENDIIGRASNAVELYEATAQEEQNQLNEISKYLVGRDTSNSQLQQSPQLPEVDTSIKVERVCNSDHINVPESVGEEVEMIYLCGQGTENIVDWEKLENYGKSTMDERFTSNTHIIALEKETGLVNGYEANQKKSSHDISIEFKITCDRFYTDGYGGFRISVWDENSKRFKYACPQTGLEECTHGIYKVTFPDAKERIVRLELAGNFYGIAVPKGQTNTITKTTRPSGKKALFVGNSWTQGTLGTKGATTDTDADLFYARRYNSYVNILCESLGLECINNGVGATGFAYYSVTGDTYKKLWYANRVEMMLEKGVQPDVIFLGGAGNDVLGKKDTTEIVAEAQNCINNIKTHSSDIKVVIIGVEKVTGEDIRDDFDNAESVNEALKAFAKENNIPFIDFLTNKTYSGNGEALTSGEVPFVVASDIGADNMHPTKEGHIKIGLRLAEEVQSLFKEFGW